MVWFVEEGSGSVCGLELDYYVLFKIGRQSSSLTSAPIHDVIGWIHTRLHKETHTTILNVRDLGIDWSKVFSINL